MALEVMVRRWMRRSLSRMRASFNVRFKFVVVHKKGWFRDFLSELRGGETPSARITDDSEKISRLIIGLDEEFREGR